MLTDKQIKLFKKWYGVNPPAYFEITKNTGLLSNKRFVIHVSVYEQINDAAKFIRAVLSPQYRRGNFVSPIEIMHTETEPIQKKQNTYNEDDEGNTGVIFSDMNKGEFGFALIFNVGDLYLFKAGEDINRDDSVSLCADGMTIYKNPNEEYQ